MQVSDDHIYKKLEQYKTANSIAPPVGWVQIYYDNILVEEKQNLVLAQGRGVSSQRVFNTNLTNYYEEIEDFREHTVSHFAVGSGGAVITGDDAYTLQGPHICDPSLYRPISLGNLSLYLNDRHEYSEGDGQLHNSEHSIKEIDEITLVSTDFPSQSQVETGPVCSEFTKVRCVCRLEDEPAALESGASVQISEAGLYAVRKDFEANNEEPRPIIFAHICFSPKFKEKEKPFSIIWYILC